MIISESEQHFPIIVILKPSYVLLGLCGLFSILLFAVILSIPIPKTLHFLLILYVIVRMGLAVRHHILLQSPKACRLVEVLSNDTMRISLVNGETYKVKLLPSTFVSLFLVVLNAKVIEEVQHQKPRTITVIITSWQLSRPDPFRRLRVWLTWGYRANVIN